MLNEEQVKPLILHPDRFVCIAAAEYFHDCWSRDAELAPMILEALERYGEKESIGLLRNCRRFPLTNESLARVIERLGRTEWESNIDHLNSMIGRMPGALFAENEALVRGAPNLDAEVLTRLEKRCVMERKTGAELWEEMQELARRWDETDEEDEIDCRYADDLAEALAAHETPDSETICRLLDSPDVMDKWLEIFLVILAGARRLKAAAPSLMKKMQSESDYLMEEAAKALPRIGEPQTALLVRETFRSGDWYFRLNGSTVLGGIKSPESEEAALALLEGETDSTVRTSLCDSLCRLFSERGVEVVTREIERGYDRSFMTLESALLPVLDALGIETVPTKNWREEREKEAARFERFLADEYEKGEAGQSYGGYAPEREYEPPLILRAEPKIGRNEPCPCGSGKKFKKCCGMEK